MARRGKPTHGPSGGRGEVGRVRRRRVRPDRLNFDLPRVINRLSSKVAPTQERTFLGLSTARLAVLFLVLCGLGLTLAMPLRTYFTQREQAEVVAAERARLDAQIEELQARKDQQADPAYIRAQARDRLRLVMPGETPLQVQLPGDYEKDLAKRARKEPAPPPWYVAVWNSVAYPPDYQWDPANPTGPEPEPEEDPLDPIDPIN